MHRSMLFLLAALACAPEAAEPDLSSLAGEGSLAEALPSHLAAAVLPLTLSVSGPFEVGTRITMTVTGVPKNKTVVLVGSVRASGAAYCPRELTQTCTDLFAPGQFLSQTTSNASGVATFRMLLKEPLPVGQMAYVQALAKVGPNEFKSNVIAQPFLAPVTSTSTTVEAIRTGTHAVGDLLEIEGAVVTGVGSNGFTVQQPGVPTNAGLYVFHNGDFPGITEGDVVRVVGVYEEFAGSGGTAPLDTLTELIALASNPDAEIEVTGTGVVAPVELTVAQVASAATAEPYEGMLVRLEDGPNLEVVGVDGFAEITVKKPGGVDLAVIDNEFFSLAASTPDLGAGATYTSITGAMFFSFGSHKVAPRELADGAGYQPFVGDTDTDTDTIVDTDTDTDTDTVVDTDTDTDTDTDLPVPGPLFISKVSDHTNTSFRYVEIYNPGPVPFPLTGYAIRRYSNGSSTSSATIPLTSTTLNDGQAWVVGNSGTADWAGTFGTTPQQFSGEISANGDDVYALSFDDGTGYVDVDVYGVIGVDGTGQPWEYVDQIAVRSCDVIEPTLVFDFAAEWALVAPGGVAPLIHCAN